MRPRRPISIAAALAAALLLAGCQTPVVTMINPPGWGGASAPAETSSAAATIDEVRFADVPSICGIPSGTLDDGALAPAPNSTPIGGGSTTPVASEVRLADDPGTGKPLVSFGADAGGAVGAAAVFSCTIDGVEYRDRVVVWDASLQPLGVINLSTLRGTGPVSGTELVVDPVSVRVTFFEVGEGTPAEPAGTRMQVPLTVEGGHLAVGALTIG